MQARDEPGRRCGPIAPVVPRRRAQVAQVPGRDAEVFQGDLEVVAAALDEALQAHDGRVGVFDRLPNLRLDPAQPRPWITGLLFRMPTAVPVVFDA